MAEVNNSDHYPIFQRTEFIDELDPARKIITRADALARELRAKNFNRIVFVGCGAPFRITNIITYWIKLSIPEALVHNYLPADFMDHHPPFVDEQTIVIFGSYSGTTKETVEAARFAADLKCLRLVITRFDDSPLSQHADKKLNFGDVKLGDYSRFMITTAFVSSLLSQLYPNSWTVHPEMMKTLQILPQVLGDVVEQNETKIRGISEKYYTNDSMFVVGHGSMYNTSYLLAFCSFMEMQRIHATPIIGAEFFHGPFELIDNSFPVIVLIGEDPTRQQGLRIKQFCENYVDTYEIFDSRDFTLEGIPEHLRGFFSPIVLDAATRRFMDYYAILRDHDKSQRRYMGVVEY